MPVFDENFMALVSLENHEGLSFDNYIEVRQCHAKSVDFGTENTKTNFDLSYVSATNVRALFLIDGTFWVRVKNASLKVQIQTEVKIGIDKGGGQILREIESGRWNSHPVMYNAIQHMIKIVGTTFHPNMMWKNPDDLEPEDFWIQAQKVSLDLFDVKIKKHGV